MKVSITLEVEVNPLADGRYNAIITIPVSETHSHRQMVFPFAVGDDGVPRIRGEGGGHNVLCDILKAAMAASGSKSGPPA